MHLRPVYFACGRSSAACCTPTNCRWHHLWGLAMYRQPCQHLCGVTFLRAACFDCHYTFVTPWCARACVSAPATQCCKHFPPVFRHFFLEAFPDPCEWFEARTRYTRSTAVASMAGAVIGLGDRHLGNILLDMHSAEVSAHSVWLLLTAVAVAVRGHGPGCSAGSHTLPHGPVVSGMLPAQTWGSGHGYVSISLWASRSLGAAMTSVCMHGPAYLPTCLLSCLLACLCAAHTACGSGGAHRPGHCL